MASREPNGKHAFDRVSAYIIETSSSRSIPPGMVYEETDHASN